jgi:hypothetical protein
VLGPVIAGTVPEAPTNLVRATGVTPEDTKITLDWDDAVNGGSPIIKYVVYWDRGGLDASPITPLIETGPTITFYTVEGLTRGTTYKFQVLANNAVGDGPPTTTFAAISAQAPGIPTSIVRLTKDSETSMQLSWTAPTDDGGSPLTLDYEIHSDDGLASGYNQLVSSTGGATSYLVTGLVADTVYYFKVKAKNEVGQSGLSLGAGFRAGSIPS